MCGLGAATPIGGIIHGRHHPGSRSRPPKASTGTHKRFRRSATRVLPVPRVPDDDNWRPRPAAPKGHARPAPGPTRSVLGAAGLGIPPARMPFEPRPPKPRPSVKPWQREREVRGVLRRWALLTHPTVAQCGAGLANRRAAQPAIGDGLMAYGDAVVRRVVDSVPDRSGRLWGCCGCIGKGCGSRPWPASS
jgi:hypothetical protein